MAWAIAKSAPKTWLITDGERLVGSVVQNEHRRFSVEILCMTGMDYRFRCSTIDAARAYAIGVEAGQRSALATATLVPR